METRRYRRLRVRWILLALVLAGVAAAAVSERDALATAAHLAARASPGWIVAAAAAIGGVYVFRAAAYGVALRTLGHAPRLRFLVGAAVVATSLHQLLPTAGASGYAFLTYAFHRRGLSSGRASLVALLDTLSYAVPAALLVVASLAYVFLSGGAGSKRIAMALLPGLALVALGVGVYWLQRDRDRLIALVLRLKHWTVKRLGVDWPDAPVRRFLVQFYSGKEVIADRPKAFALMAVFQLLTFACDTLALYMVCLSLGVAPPLWLAVLAFVLAMAGMGVLGLPAGGGSFEVIMSVVLIRHGLAVPVAIAASLLYRLVAFWLPVLTSFVVLWRLRWEPPLDADLPDSAG